MQTHKKGLLVTGVVHKLWFYRCSDSMVKYKLILKKQIQEIKKYPTVKFTAC
jgi:hypothetical protein